MKKMIIVTVAINILVTVATIAFADILIYDGFPDVKKDSYYYDAVKNMSLNGYMNGYSNGNFGPDDSMTRGQLAVVIDRFNQRVNSRFNLTVSETDLQELYGLKYVCPSEYLTCLGIDDIIDPPGCYNDSYMAWVESHCVNLPD